MKFMPQDVFEVVVISLAKYKLLSNSDYLESKNFIFNCYRDSYKGDVLWMSQAEEMIVDVEKVVSQIGIKDKFKYYTIASEFRQRLDENLEIPRTLKKIFGGTIFTTSHPAPMARKEIALKNIKRLTIMISSNGYSEN